MPLTHDHYVRLRCRLDLLVGNQQMQQLQQLLELAQEAGIFAKGKRLDEVRPQIERIRQIIEEYLRGCSGTERGPSEVRCSDAESSSRLQEHDKEAASLTNTATPTIEMLVVSCGHNHLRELADWARNQALSQHVQRMQQLLARLADVRLIASLGLDTAIIELKSSVESLAPGPITISKHCYMIRSGKGATLELGHMASLLCATIRRSTIQQFFRLIIRLILRYLCSTAHWTPAPARSKSDRSESDDTPYKQTRKSPDASQPSKHTAVYPRKLWAGRMMNAMAYIILQAEKLERDGVDRFDRVDVASDSADSEQRSGCTITFDSVCDNLKFLNRCLDEKNSPPTAPGRTFDEVSFLAILDLTVAKKFPRPVQDAWECWKQQRACIQLWLENFAKSEATVSRIHFMHSARHWLQQAIDWTNLLLRPLMLPGSSPQDGGRDFCTPYFALFLIMPHLIPFEDDHQPQQESSAKRLTHSSLTAWVGRMEQTPTEGPNMTQPLHEYLACRSLYVAELECALYKWHHPPHDAAWPEDVCFLPFPQVFWEPSQNAQKVKTKAEGARASTSAEVMCTPTATRVANTQHSTPLCTPQSAPRSMRVRTKKLESITKCVECLVEVICGGDEASADHDSEEASCSQCYTKLRAISGDLTKLLIEARENPAEECIVSTPARDQAERTLTDILWLLQNDAPSPRFCSVRLITLLQQLECAYGILASSSEESLPEWADQLCEYAPQFRNSMLTKMCRWRDVGRVVSNRYILAQGLTMNPVAANAVAAKTDTRTSQLSTELATLLRNPLVVGVDRYQRDTGAICVVWVRTLDWWPSDHTRPTETALELDDSTSSVCPVEYWLWDARTQPSITATPSVAWPSWTPCASPVASSSGSEPPTKVVSVPDVAELKTTHCVEVREVENNMGLESTLDETKPRDLSEAFASASIMDPQTESGDTEVAVAAETASIPSEVASPRAGSAPDDRIVMLRRVDTGVVERCIFVPFSEYVEEHSDAAAQHRIHTKSTDSSGPELSETSETDVASVAEDDATHKLMWPNDSYSDWPSNVLLVHKEYSLQTRRAYAAMDHFESLTNNPLVTFLTIGQEYNAASDDIDLVVLCGVVTTDFWTADGDRPTSMSVPHSNKDPVQLPLNIRYFWGGVCEPTVGSSWFSPFSWLPDVSEHLQIGEPPYASSLPIGLCGDIEWADGTSSSAPQTWGTAGFVTQDRNSGSPVLVTASHIFDRDTSSDEAPVHPVKGTPVYVNPPTYQLCQRRETLWREYETLQDPTEEQVTTKQFLSRVNDCQRGRGSWRFETFEDNWQTNRRTMSEKIRAKTPSSTFPDPVVLEDLMDCCVQVGTFRTSYREQGYDLAVIDLNPEILVPHTESLDNGRALQWSVPTHTSPVVGHDVEQALYACGSVSHAEKSRHGTMAAEAKLQTLQLKDVVQLLRARGTELQRTVPAMTNVDVAYLPLVKGDSGACVISDPGRDAVFGVLKEPVLRPRAHGVQFATCRNGNLSLFHNVTSICTVCGANA